MKTSHIEEKDIDFAAELLKRGEVVAFPTETVFGLGVIYDDKFAFEKLVEAKKRPANKPFTLMCSSIEQIIEVAKVNEDVKRIIDAFMPGPITLLLPVKENVPHWVTLGYKTIGVRIPKYDLALKLIEKVGKPLLVPSANLAGENPCLNDKQVSAVFENEIAGIVIGNAKMEKPSTIVDLSENNIKLIREGCISFAEIEKIWRKK